MTHHIVIIGKTGQLARALSAQAGPLGYKVTCYGREACDLSASEDKIRSFAKALPKCDAMIIGAAYTAVDAAENDEETALQVNGIAPAIFAQICHERAIPIVHLSTDYVFQGHGQTPLTPDMPTDPINAYGRSKLAGETSVLNSGARAVILRTSWVFDGSGKNFMTTMLRLGTDRQALSVVNDQYGRPTFAPHLAQACFAAASALIAGTDPLSKIYHVSNTGPVMSWADFASAIFKAAKDYIPHEVTVSGISSSEYPTPAKRPSYSVMDVSAFEGDLNFKLPSWSSALEQAIADWAK